MGSNSAGEFENILPDSPDDSCDSPRPLVLESDNNSSKKHLHPCSRCKNTFKNQTALTKHASFHCKEMFSCDDCGKVVGTKGGEQVLDDSVVKQSYDSDQNRNDRSSFACKYFDEDCFPITDNISKYVPSYVTYAVCVKRELQENAEHGWDTEVCPKHEKHEVSIRTKLDIRDGEVVDDNDSNLEAILPDSADEISDSLQPSVIESPQNNVLPRSSGIHLRPCSQRSNLFQSQTVFTKHVTLHSNKERFPCNECGKLFGTKSLLSEHGTTHSQTRPHACPYCGRSFKSRKYLTRHVARHTGSKSHVCDRCGKSFKRRPELTLHLSAHSDDRPHPCDACKKTFKTKGDLLKHFLCHSEERPYSCGHCAKAFKTKKELVQHLSIHSDDRPHSCKRCGKAFKTKSTLAKHLACHSEQRPYSCEHCEKTFKRKSGLVKHLPVHSQERNHPCNVCEKTFKRKSGLAKHLPVHFQERNHPCDICKKTFKSKGDLTTHLLQHSK